jgi:hypothetical protein
VPHWQTKRADAWPDGEISPGTKDAHKAPIACWGLRRPERIRAVKSHIAQLVARWAASFALDPDGVTRTKTLGSERMSRKLRDALPGGDEPLRGRVGPPVLSTTGST